MNSNENNSRRLQELNGSHYEIAKGEDDITGWDVKDGQGNKLGDVDDLIFDEGSLKVRYLILDLDDNDDLGLEDRKVLIPIGMAQLDEEDDDVILPNITTEHLRSLPDYDKDNLTSDFETQTYSTIAAGTAVTGIGADFYNNEHFNEDNLYRNRRRNREDENLKDENMSTDKLQNQENETTIPIIEENLEVGKREVEHGGIRIRSRVVETPVEENIRLREEHVTVERENVDRPATERDFTNADEREIEARERAEIPVVNKEARVVEEIKLKKDVTERDETVNDTVRKTEVDVDKLNKNDRGESSK